MAGLLNFDDPQSQGLIGMGMGLLGASGPSATPVSLGQALGQGWQMGQQGYQSAVEGQYRKSQMDEFKRKQLEAQQKQMQIAAFRDRLPPEQQQLFDVAPDEFIKSLPDFQKPQLVETVDPKEPLRTMKQWMKPGETTGPVAGYGAMPEILDPRVIGAKTKIAEAGRAEGVKVFNNTKDNFKNERDLRNDFAGLPTTKAFNEVQSAYDQIQVAIKKESPAGDLAAATKIMKILDPGSVVRESELGMAMAASGLLDRVQNYAQMTISGQKLTPTQRKDFGSLAEQLYNAAAERYDQSASEYQGVASEYGLNPNRVAKPAKRSAISGGGWSATRK